MKQSEDLINKISLLSEEEQEIGKKLLEYIDMKQYSNSRMEELVKSDIREIVWKEDLE